MWAGFEDFINEVEQSPEFEVMAALDDEQLPSKSGGPLPAGSRLRIETPGGGAHGAA